MCPATMRRYVTTRFALVTLTLTLPPTLAAAQDTGPDPNLAPPLSHRLAEKLSRGVGLSEYEAPSFGRMFGGGRTLARVDAGEAPLSNVVSLDARRHARMRVYSVASAAAMVLLVISTLQRKPIERTGERFDAWLSPTPTAPVPTVPPPHEATPQEKADQLREEAFVDVQKGYLDEAEDKLLDAKELDPAGDDDPRALQAYRTIKAESSTGPETMSKPPIAPYERPLKKH